MSQPTARVYIIESPHPCEIRASEMEGRAIAEALQLARHEKKYWLAVDREQLTQVLDEVVTDLGPRKREAEIVPIFHFSAHGNEDGIELTNGDFVSWHDLSDLLWRVGYRTGRINQAGHALAHITMSSCKGVHGKKMFDLSPNKAPAVSLVGPNDDIGWTDSLTAWIVFYHLVLSKAAPPPDVLGIMNQAAGSPAGFALYAHGDSKLFG